MYVNLKSDYISVNQIFFSSQQSNNIDLIGADIGFSLSKWNKALYFILLQDDDNSGRVLWFYRVDKVYIEALTAKWIWNVWLWVLVVIFCILNIWYTTRYIYGIVYISTTYVVQYAHDFRSYLAHIRRDHGGVGSCAFGLQGARGNCMSAVGTLNF